MSLEERECPVALRPGNAEVVGRRLGRGSREHDESREDGEGDQERALPVAGYRAGEGCEEFGHVREGGGNRGDWCERPIGDRGNSLDRQTRERLYFLTLQEYCRTGPVIPSFRAFTRKVCLRPRLRFL